MPSTEILDLPTGPARVRREDLPPVPGPGAGQDEILAWVSATKAVMNGSRVSESEAGQALPLSQAALPGAEQAQQALLAAGAGEAILVQDMTSESSARVAAENLKGLARIPAGLIRFLVGAGVRWVLTDGSVTAGIPFLSGKPLEGWPEGSTWDIVPGVYSREDRTVVLGTGAGWNDRTAIHETGHAVGETLGLDDSEEWAAVRAVRPPDTEYEAQPGDTGAVEHFAEAFVEVILGARRGDPEDEWVLANVPGLGDLTHSPSPVEIGVTEHYPGGEDHDQSLHGAWADGMGGDRDGGPPGSRAMPGSMHSRAQQGQAGGASRAGQREDTQYDYLQRVQKDLEHSKPKIRPDSGVEAFTNDQIAATGDNLGQAVDMAYGRAWAYADRVRPILARVIEAVGGELFGFEFEFKEHESIARKVAGKVETGQGAAGQVAASLGDVLRYTVGFGGRDLARGAMETARLLEEAGWEVQRENAWADPLDSYNGLNWNFRDPTTGFRFEIQFHTEWSWRLKQFDLHPDYQILRAEGSTIQERRAAYDRMVAMNAAALEQHGLPPGIDDPALGRDMVYTRP